MIKWFLGLMAVTAVLALSYWVLMLGTGSAKNYSLLDIQHIRELANALPGQKPESIAFEEVALMETPGSAIVAGDPLGEAKTIGIYAYEVRYPTWTAMIDTGVTPKIAEDLEVVSFDQAAYKRVSSALERARVITVTHEHSDHIGGLVGHSNFIRLLGQSFLTKSQLVKPARYAGVTFPSEAMESYKAVELFDYLAIAPGIVLINAEGHTPGSTIVYVQTEDKTEYLFVGDIAWHYRNIELNTSRPRLVSQFVLQENSALVNGQIAALVNMTKSYPDILIVPGHDQTLINKLEQRGKLVQGFQ